MIALPISIDLDSSALYLRHSTPRRWNSAGLGGEASPRNVPQIQTVMKRLESASTELQVSRSGTENRPLPRIDHEQLEQIVEEVFRIAAELAASSFMSHSCAYLARREYTAGKMG